MLQTLTCETFSQYLNKTFRIHTDSAIVDAELIEASTVGQADEEQGRRAPFSVIFRTDKEQLFGQGVFRIEAEGFGEAELFLVPIGLDDEGARYEAVFG